MDLQGFTDKIDKDLTRRKLELSRLTILAKSQHPDTAQEALSFRASVAFSYAHWEGFSKSASMLYVKFINSQKVRVIDLKLCLQAAHLHSSLRRAGASPKLGYLGGILEELDVNRSAIFSATPEKCVDTESNLSSEVFKSLVLGLGLPYLDAYSTRQAFIDEKIVHSRNQVVHGELIPFSRDEALERLEAVRELIDLYGQQLIDAARGQLYLAP